MDTVDTVVIGAGVVGLACARALAQAGHEVIILEQEGHFGEATSARNSEVIHAGLYYPSGSLKARLCVQGKHLLYDFCQRHGVGHARIGKLIVACDDRERAALANIQTAALNAGVNDLQELSRVQALALEPALHCVAALGSPSTGIIDSHGLMLALLGDAEREGAMLALRSPVVGARYDAPGLTLNVRSDDGHISAVLARQVVNSAGLHAPAVARLLHELPTLHIAPQRYAKGCYYALSGRAPFSRLIYPAPGAAGHLGLHLTLDLAGQARFGPSFRWVDEIDYSVDTLDDEHALHTIRRYWPGLPDGALHAGYTGVRPKIHGPGEPMPDFRIDGPALHGIPGWVNLFGIESPGLTASLAIAQEVIKCLAE